MFENRSEEYRVGIFVTLGVLLFAATVLFLGGNRHMFRSKYHLKIQFETVEGLAKGGVVQLAGMPVGNVESIGIAPGGDGMEVIVLIDQSVQPRITEGSKASMRTQGALGDKFVFIAPGPKENKPLSEGSVMEIEKGADLLSALSRKGSDVERIFTILQQVELFVTQLNAGGRTEKIMSNLADATEELKKATGQANLLLKDIRGDKDTDGSLKKSLSHLTSVLEKIDKGTGTLGGLVNDSSIHDKLKEILGTTKKSQNMKSLIRDTIQKAETVNP